MKIPTDKQFQQRTDSIRRKVWQLQGKVDELKSYDISEIGTTNHHHLRIALDALKIAEASLLEAKFDREA